MPFYSFKVRSPEEVVIQSRQLAIGEGFDVFSKVINDLPSFLAELNSLGVEVIGYNRLDNLESVQPGPSTFSGLLDEVVLLSDGEQHSSEEKE